MLNDRDVLEAIGKGSYWLKLKKLRALGFVKGTIPKMELTDDGKEELKRLLAQPRRPDLTDDEVRKIVGGSKSP